MLGTQLTREYACARRGVCSYDGTVMRGARERLLAAAQLMLDRMLASARDESGGGGGAGGLVSWESFEAFARRDPHFACWMHWVYVCALLCVFTVPVNPPAPLLVHTRPCGRHRG